MFTIGQIFGGVYPPEVAEWCDTNNATIETQDGGGYKIVAIVLPEPTADELADMVRTERDRRITVCDWVILRHRDELDEGSGTTLTADEYAAWLAYRKTLRDMPSADGFPWDGGGEDTSWPVEPVL